MQQFSWNSDQLFNKKTVTDFSIKTAPMYMEGMGVLPSPAFYPEEQFRVHPGNPNFLIGSKGTIYDIQARCKVNTIDTPINMEAIDFNKLPSDINSSMSAMKVHRICSLISQGYSQSEIMDTLKAEGLGAISRATFWYIKNRTPEASKWFYIIDQYDFSNAKSYNRYEKDIGIKACEMANNGHSNKEIAEALGLTSDKDAQNLITRTRTKYANDPNSPLGESVARKDWKGEELIDKVCELISRGYTYAIVSDEIQKLGGHISKNMFYGLKRRDKEYKKWTYLLDKYGIGVNKQ